MQHCEGGLSVDRLLPTGPHHPPLFQVVKAPEPDNIIWENLEFSKVKRSFRQNVTGLVSFILLLLSFGLVLGASGVQDTYSQIIPKIAYCQSEVSCFAHRSLRRSFWAVPVQKIGRGVDGLSLIF